MGFNRGSDRESSPSGKAASWSRPCKVLVADDHPPGLELATQAMRSLQCCVVGVADRIAAVEAARTGSFDLIFLDVHMPGLSWLQVADEIRRLEKERGQPRTPIVALTASAMQHEQRACLVHDMDEVLPKPLHLQALARMLRKWRPA